MIKLDKFDIGILRLLQQDAKLTTKEIAAQLGLTNTPVYERIKRLERKGYIKKYVALLDKHKIDRSLTAFCNVSLKVHSKIFLDRFEKEILELEEVMECYHIAGLYDYLLKVVVKDMEQYRNFITQKLAVFENIGNVQSSFVMTTIKHSTAYPFSKNQ